MSSTNFSNYLYRAHEQLQRYQFVSSYGHPVQVGDLPHHVFMYSLHSKTKKIYKAFCSGSIIGPVRVLSSAHCFLTNQKRPNRKLESVDVVGGILTVHTKKNINSNQQWRKITNIHSQKYYRFPAYSLAIVIIDTPWEFNSIINFIPFASVNADYDGVCFAAQTRTTTAWASTRVLFKEQMHIIKRTECEVILQRNCKIYYCTTYGIESTLSSSEAEGAGLVCFGTGDPEEIDRRGLLVGVTTLVNIQLPTLHNRIGIFRKWIKDSATLTYNQRQIVIWLITICCIHIVLAMFH